ERLPLGVLPGVSGQGRGLIRSGEGERIGNGELDVMAINTDGSSALKWQAKGALLSHVIPSDAAFVQYRYMGVPKNAAHPNTAQLFINYVASREAQDILYKYAFTDQYQLPGSKSAAAIEKAKASGAML